MKYSQQVMRARIEKVVAQGQGLARTDQGVVLIPGVLPGELVDFRLEESSPRNVLRGRIENLLEASPGRRDAPCPLYGQCGGCDLMHAGPGVQGEIRKSIFMDAMTRQGKEALKPWLGKLASLPLVQGQEWEYRSRFRFHRGPSGQPALSRRNSGQFIELDDCPVAHPLIRAWLSGKPVLPRGIGQSGNEPGDPRPAGTNPRSSRGSSHRQVRPSRTGPSDLAEQDQDFPGTVPDGFRVFASRSGLFLDQDECRVPVLDQEFRFRQKAFFQSNIPLLESLLLWLRPRLETWLDSAGPDFKGEMADLYGGVGTFSRFLPDSGTLWLVEQNTEACASARLSMKDRKNLRIHSGDVDRWLSRAGRLDLVVVDPPRGGLSPDLTARLCTQKPGILVYVSCDPVTLARDARLLVAAGFTLADGALFDFYPQTWHLESVLVFTPGGARA